MRLLIVPLAAAGFAFAVVTGATQLVKPATPAVQPPTSLIWADRVFANRHQLQRWLRARGATYGEWQRHHPSASTIFAPRATSATSKRPLQAATRTTSRSNTDKPLGIALLVVALGGLLLLGAATRMELSTFRALTRRDALPSVRLRIARARPRLAAATAPLGRVAPRRNDVRGESRPGLAERIVTGVTTHASVIAWYATAILLGLASGTSIALYLT